MQIHLKGGAVMEDYEVQKSELVNMIYELRKEGWNDSKIVDHILKIHGEVLKLEEKKK